MNWKMFHEIKEAWWEYLFQFTKTHSALLSLQKLQHLALKRKIKLALILVVSTTSALCINNNKINSHKKIKINNYYAQTTFAAKPFTPS